MRAATSTVALRNTGASPLHLQWTGAGEGEATLAPGMERRLAPGGGRTLLLQDGARRAVVVLAAQGRALDAQGAAVLAGLPAGEQTVGLSRVDGRTQTVRIQVPADRGAVVEFQAD